MSSVGRSPEDCLVNELMEIEKDFEFEVRPNVGESLVVAEEASEEVGHQTYYRGFAGLCQAS
jgi:hypothetical protein